MASAEKLQLQEKVRLGSRSRKVSELLVLSLLLTLLARRSVSLLPAGSGGGGAAPSCTWCRVAALICEAWFAVAWFLHMSGKWNPALFDTHPEGLAGGRTGSVELPAVDMFVTAADPTMDSSPVLMASAVLSLLAADYPAGKLACYVSDDACSPATCHALREAAGFAKLWVPFCKKYGVRVRAPLPYFSSSSGPEHGGAAGHDESSFLRDWIAMKTEFEKLVDRIVEGSRVQSWDWDGEFDEFLGTESRDHPTIIKVLWDNTKCKEGEGLPSLIYISREKNPKHQHHFQAGAMDVLTRVSGVLTNAPIILNVERNMFASNPHFALHAVCILLGFDDEVDKATQKFYGAIKDDDPFWNQTAVMYANLGFGIAWLHQGMFYGGMGCFHRRKVVYSVPQDSTMDVQPGRMKGSPSYKELQKKFSSSEELIELEGCIISGNMLAAQAVDLSGRIEKAKEISGQEIGWVYGSMMHHILTGQKIHTFAGRSSTFFNPDPLVFLGSAGALTGGPASLTQHKRWATGLLEILLGRNNPVLLFIFKHIELRQCLAYLAIDVSPLRAPFELCYALLGPYCLLANQSFLPKASEPDFIILIALLASYSQYSFTEYVFMDCRPSVSAWWNNLRMQLIVSSSAWLLAFPTVALKTLGLSETVLEVTREEQGAPGGDAAGATSAELGRFTFDSSPVFVPPTALTILTVVAIAVGAWRAAVGAPDAAGGPGAGEFLCCGWLVHCFWPFVRGLAGKGRYGIPWSVKVKAGLLVAAFVYFSTRN